MNKIVKSLNKNIYVVLSVIMTYSLFIFSTMVSDTCVSKYRHEVLIIFGLSMSVLLFLNELLIHKKLQESRDLSIVLFVMGTLMLIGAVREREMIKAAGGWRYRFQFIELIAGCYLCVFRTWSYHKKNKIKFIDIPLKKIIEEYFLLIIVVAIAVIMAGVHAGAQERGDELIMYNGIQKIRIFDFFNLSATSSTHLDPFYVIYCGIWKFVFEDNALGMNVASFSLYVLSCFSVYGIVKFLFPEKKPYEMTLLTAVYVFSPFMLGLSITNSWDYFTMVLFPIVVYFEMKKRYALHFIFAIAMVFSKEPMIVVYAGFCIGVVLKDIIERRKENKLFFKILKNPKYYIMILIGISWVVIYEYMPKWGGVPDILQQITGTVKDASENVEEVNSFARFQIPTIGYLVERGIVFFILHFNWILTIGALLGLGIGCLKNKKNVLTETPLLMAEISFIIFSIFLNAGNAVRYMDIHASAISMLFIIGIAQLGNIMRMLCSIVVTVLMLISLYRPIDPLSLKYMSAIDVGNTKVLGSALVTRSNFQYVFMDELIDQAIETPIKDGKLIIFPMTNGAYTGHLIFEGAHYFSEEGFENFYWDDDRNQRFTASEDGWSYIEDDWIPFKVYNIISSEDLVEKLEGYNEAYYFCFPYIGMNILSELESLGYVIETEKIEYNGWIITRAHLVWE